MELRFPHFTQDDKLWCQLMVISHIYFTKSTATILKTIPNDLKKLLKNMMELKFSGNQQKTRKGK